MVSKSSKEIVFPLWKVTIAEKILPEDIELILADALKERMLKEPPSATYGLLERIDISDKETTVFMTGDETTIKTFSECCKKRNPKLKVALSTTTLADITKFKN